MIAPIRVFAVGAGLPSFRLAAADIAAAWGDPAGKGQVAVCAADEDVLTLSWDAAAAAIAAAGIDPTEIDGLWWGTSRPPFAEGPSWSTLATAIGLPTTVTGALLAGSPHSGIEALLAAADAVSAGSARIALVIAADAVVPGLGTSYERRCGAGAAAWLLASDRGGAAITSRVTRQVVALDRYRGDRESSTRDVYDPRLVREEVFLPSVLSVGAELAAGDPTGWALPDPDGRLGAAAAKKLGATRVTGAEAGDAGAADALLTVTTSLATAGRYAVVAHGGGRTTGVLVEVDEPVAGAAITWPVMRAASYAEVLRARGQLEPSGESVAMGVPPASAGFVRGATEMLQLLGARCVECGTVNTPPSVHPHCISCGGDKMAEVALPRAGVVHTFVVNQTMPAPFVAPLPLAVIDLDEGARLMLQVTGDATGLAIGDSVHLVLRRYAVERGAPVYGYKAVRG